MSRPVDNRLNRSGYGELSETDQQPLTGQDQPDAREGQRTKPDEQTRGHEHDDPDRPDHVHPALAMDDSSDAGSNNDRKDDSEDTA